jgi:hypothetical protein
MIEHLSSVVLVNRLGAVRAVVETASLVGRLDAEPLSWDKRAEIGQPGH